LLTGIISLHVMLLHSVDQTLLDSIYHPVTKTSWGSLSKKRKDRKRRRWRRRRIWWRKSRRRVL